MKLRRLRRHILAILMWGPLLLEFTGTAGAQPAGQAGPAPVAQSFGELKGRIRVRCERLRNRSTGHELSGKVTALSDTSLDLLSDGKTHAFSPADVGSIKVRQRDSLWNGLIIGAVAGMTPAVYWLFADPNECGGSICMVDLLTGVIPSAAIGLAIDAAVQKKGIVFRSPSS